MIRSHGVIHYSTGSVNRCLQQCTVVSHCRRKDDMRVQLYGISDVIFLPDLDNIELMGKEPTADRGVQLAMVMCAPRGV